MEVLVERMYRERSLTTIPLKTAKEEQSPSKCNSEKVLSQTHRERSGCEVLTVRDREQAVRDSRL